MLGLRLRTDSQPRWKKGKAAQSTTGLARSNSIQTFVRSSTQLSNDTPIIGAIATIRSGIDRTALTQNRLVKSTSSGFGPSSPDGTPIGSSAMPQIGQEPGLSRTISGCIGQVYCVPL